VIFAKLEKVDAVQRTVYGIAISETLDRSGEIFDYQTSKPEFEKWSSDIRQATDGKSFGNVRAMHGHLAIGKVTDISFDDAGRAIHVAAKIVDDAEWKKVEEGVYTGFSIGGKYLKRWQDGDLKRYTAVPSELSLVDMPCVPTATFTMIKADGTEELRKFALSPGAVERMRAIARLDASRAGIVLQMPQRLRQADLRKAAVVAEILHQSGRRAVDAGRRLEFGEVDTGDGHRVMLSHDQGADMISIHGVSFDLDQIAPDLRAAFGLASSAFIDAANDSAAQSSAKALLSVVLSAILQRHDAFIGAPVRERLHRQRYAV
jgi:hypothetical protein